MATLEKIRSKSVLLIIVIGVALLAFIVGDAITNGRNLFGDPTTIAKVDGEKIDITEFQRRYEEASNQMQNSGQKVDEQQLASQVMNQLIMEKIIENAVKDLGIEVSSDELSLYMFSGQNPDLKPVFNGLMSLNPKTQPQSMEQVYDMIFNPKKYGLTEQQVAPLQQAWVNAEAKAKHDLAMSKYVTLLQGCYVANDLDKRAMYNQENISYTTRMACKPYGEIDAKKYPVSDAELKAKYEEQKNRYRIDEPTKSLSVIAVQVSPSDADVKANAELARRTADAMRKGNQAVDKLKTEGVAMQHHTVRAGDLNPAIKNFVTSAPADSVSILNQGANGFTVVRNGRNTAEVDSVQMNLVVVAGKKLPDTVLAKLNAGVSIDSIPALYKDSVFVQKDAWRLFVDGRGRANQLMVAQGVRPVNLDNAKKESILNAGSDYFVLDKQDEYTVLTQVLKKNAPISIYEYDQVDYVLVPSNKTIEDARAKLENYIAKNNDPAKFAANAAKSGYTPVQVMVSASTPGLSNGFTLLPNSRPVVRWAVQDGKKGEISSVFDNGDTQNPWIYAAAIVNEYEDFIPYNDATVKAALEQQIRAAKYGDALVKEYSAKGNTVDEVAEAMGVPVADRDVRLSNPGEVGDATVTGMIVMTKAGQPVKVVKGDKGVYAYQVTKVVDNGLTYDDAKYTQQYMMKHQPNLERMLRFGKKIDNRLLKFYGGK